MVCPREGASLAWCLGLGGVPMVVQLAGLRRYRPSCTHPTVDNLKLKLEQDSRLRLKNRLRTGPGQLGFAGVGGAFCKKVVQSLFWVGVGATHADRYRAMPGSNPPELIFPGRFHEHWVSRNTSTELFLPLQFPQACAVHAMFFPDNNSTAMEHSRGCAPGICKDTVNFPRKSRFP